MPIFDPLCHNIGKITFQPDIGVEQAIDQSLIIIDIPDKTPA